MNRGFGQGNRATSFNSLARVRASKVLTRSFVTTCGHRSRTHGPSKLEVVVDWVVDSPQTFSVCPLVTDDCHAEIMRVIFLDIDGVLVTRRPCIMEETLCSISALSCCILSYFLPKLEQAQAAQKLQQTPSQQKVLISLRSPEGPAGQEFPVRRPLTESDRDIATALTL